MRWGTRKRALSTAELLIAIALLAMVTVTLTVFFLWVTLSSTKTSDQTVAYQIADRVLGLYADGRPSLWPDSGTRAETQEATHGTDSVTEFTYQLDWKAVSRPTDPRLMGDLYRLDVTVSWQKDARRPDYGRLEVHASQVVFVEVLR